jgi:nucleoside-diphosphate-sugar epimerase
MKQAWIAGATGLVGHLLSEKLSELGVYDGVFKLVRTNAKIGGSGTPVVVNYDHLMFKAEQEADFFCCLGSTIKKAGSQQAFRLVDEKYVVRFAEEAKKSGARCMVIVSAAGSNAQSNFFYNRVKGQMEGGVRRVGLRSVYILRPSLLLGERNEKRSSESFAMKLAPLMSAFMVGPFKKYRPIQASRVAEIAMQCAAQAQPGFHILEGFE